MRPKKKISELRDTSCVLRLTQDEKQRFWAQAKTRGMELSAYLRALAAEEGEKLVAAEKLRRNSSGGWEVQNMGTWEDV